MFTRRNIQELLVLQVEDEIFSHQMVNCSSVYRALLIGHVKKQLVVQRSNDVALFSGNKEAKNATVAMATMAFGSAKHSISTHTTLCGKF